MELKWLTFMLWLVYPMGMGPVPINDDENISLK
jgi:hypothetical protein